MSEFLSDLTILTEAIGKISPIVFIAFSSGVAANSLFSLLRRSRIERTKPTTDEIILRDDLDASLQVNSQTHDAGKHSVSYSIRELAKERRGVEEAVQDELSRLKKQEVWPDHYCSKREALLLARRKSILRHGSQLTTILKYIANNPEDPLRSREVRQ